MPLKFPGTWRFEPPPDGEFFNRSISREAANDCVDLIEKIRTAETRWATYEHFKRAFNLPSRSSSEDWAYSDLHSAIASASKNAPVFIESIYDACEDLRGTSGEWFVPDFSHLNAILARHKIGYEIRPPALVLREHVGPVVAVEPPPPTFAEEARTILETSLSRSDELLSQGRAREAVQEVLWLLETVSTAFAGIDTQSGKVEGKYFSKIVGDLQKKMPGTTLTSVLGWITTMHGYLSAPTGGGVRHGMDLRKGVDLDVHQARLFCNLTRSYISFLIGEYGAMSRNQRP
jgi:hypothetical protein